jgi:glycosyltransferase involved in cell wall biosynthesis
VRAHPLSTIHTRPVGQALFLRLGLYTDVIYRSDGETLSTDRAFIRFVTSMPPRIEELVLFGRLDPEPGRSPYPLPRERVRLVPLPHYPSVFSVAGLVGAAPASSRIFAAELERLDAVWLFGPHPLAVLFARVARRRGKPVVLGVRQNYPEYIGNRLPSRRWLWAVGAAHALERAYRRLARTMPTVVLGDELARNYAGGGGRVLVTGFSLIRDAELVSLDEALDRSWDGELRLISVGRLDPEKNPLLLLDVLARLRGRGGRWRLTVVGDGPVRPAVEARAKELELGEAVEFLGYVPNGERLWSHYRASNAFLHVSLTEGLPQVLFEAQAAGLPIVATDVGGVRAALGGGETGLLVPPSDPDAAVRELERLRDDPELRRRLIATGLEAAARETMDAQIERILEFFRAELPLSD